MQGAASLTLGLVFPGEGLQRWQANAIEHVLAAGGVKLGALRQTTAKAARDPSESVLLWERLVYRKSVSRLQRVEAPKPTATASPNLYIDLGGTDEGAQNAALGTLSVRFCGEAAPGAMFNAVAANRPITIEVVQKLGADSRIVSSSVFPIVAEGTLAPTIDSALARAELMLSRAIESIASGEAPRGDAGDHAAPVGAPFPGLDKAKFIAGGFKYRLNRLTRPRYYFMASAPRKSTFETDLGTLATRDDVQITYAPPGYFYADPFPFDHAGEEHLFFETYDYETKLGRIDWALVKPDGSIGPVEPVLKRPYHLSYPFVFEHEGDIFMIPETGAAGQIELYRADPFPLKWTFVCPLIENIRATDATLLRRDGRFWLFATVGQNGSSTWDELHGFSAPSLFGPWTPHPQRPLKMDARSARPAGRFFEEGGRLYRPAQDCSLGYGKGLVINEIELLNETEFRERPVQRFSPEWRPGNSVFHTLNASQRFWWFDGKSARPRGR